MNYPRLERRLRESEGYSRVPYDDSLGVLTIGIGENLEDGIDEDALAEMCLTRGMEPTPENEAAMLALVTRECSEEDALILLRHHISDVEKELRRSLYWFDELDDVRKEILLDMAYNMGVPRLLGFKRTLNLVKDGDYDEAAMEMLNSRWAKQVGPRAYKLSQWMESGEIPA